MSDDTHLRSRIRGCLLGGALGDALGAPVEFMPISEIRAEFGPEGITELHEAYGRVGAITDDTQMALFTAQGVLGARTRMEARGICNPAIPGYAAYQRWYGTQTRPPPRRRDRRNPYRLDWIPELHSRRAPGTTCLSELRRGRQGTPEQPLNDSKGCGGVMRIAPVGLAGVARPFRTGCNFAALTHGHPSGWLAAGAVAWMVDRLVRGDEPAAVLDGVEGRLEREGPDADEMREALRRARERAETGEPSPERLAELGEGWVAEEALAVAVYATLASGGDVVRGLRIAVNHSGDSDSTGAIAGHLLGAWRGEDALPEAWLEKLELRDVIETVADDLVTCRLGEEWTLQERYPMD